MEPDFRTKEKIEFLNKEMDSLHVANTVFWREKTQTLATKALYHFRQNRLEEIRSELVQLRAQRNLGSASST